MKAKSLTCLIAASMLMFPALGQDASSIEPHTETKEQKDARMAWWREARFGMFIHWGLYAVPAGYYNGQPVEGYGEWIMSRGKIPAVEYMKFAKEFNPVNYDPEPWVIAAKNAGMKYIVITTKHHDGFALFDSKVNDWNVVKATPYGKDLIRPLVDACRKHDMKLGFYYSQAQDWINGGSFMSKRWDKSWKPRGMNDYIDQIVVPHVREILTQYGNDVPAVLWWDTPTGMTEEFANKIYKVVHELRPDIIMNNRLLDKETKIPYLMGDTETPEQFIPAKGFPGRDWETCMTMNKTWGFKRDDHQWKSTEHLLRNLCDIASKGGNYLLNVGPTAEGLIPQPSLDALSTIGEWMKINGEAIYGTSATVFNVEPGKNKKSKAPADQKVEILTANDWRCTTKAGKIYLHLFRWPTSRKFDLPGLQSKVTSAYLLADRKPLALEQTDAGVTLSLPADAPDKMVSVICLEIADPVAKVATVASEPAK